MSKIRTRFAPSPTGFLHVGGVRTALFAWLVARQADGEFILRIEDTDKSREIAGSEQHIIDCLAWLGLDWDEKPARQSDRLDIYKQWAQKLVDSGRAYADPLSEAELDKLRDAAKAARKPFLFRDHRPDNPPVWNGNQPLRLKSEPKAYSWHDEVMGDLSSRPEAVDDFILIKSDGYPTYNFAHVVDDQLMQITHIIRSQEFLPSVPKFLNLYEALGIANPKLATLPYVLGPDGGKKLSKRDGAKDILDYKNEGYLPEAMLNFLATLGWNDGTKQEIFSRKDLLQKFSLDRVQRGGAHFDEQRLTWMNGHWIRELPVDELYERSKAFWPKDAQLQSDDYKRQVLASIKDRLKFLSEIPNLTNFFFEDLPIDLNLIDSNKKLQKLSHIELAKLLIESKDALDKSDFSLKDLTKNLNTLIEHTDQKPDVLFSLIRIATTWAPASPGLAETLHILGRGKSLHRLQKAAEVLEK